MGDILSQEEIDVLLSATPTQKELGEQLRKCQLGTSEIVAIMQHIAGLARTDLPADDAVSEVMALADGMFGKKKPAARTRETLEELVRARHAEAFVEFEQQNLQASQRKSEESNAMGEDQQRVVCRYDFKHPARVNKDQLRTLENLHDNFARLLSSTLSGAFGAVVDVDTAFVDQTTYREFIMSLSNPSCSYQFRLGPTSGQAILDFAMPVVCATVDRIHGGKGSSKGVEARQLTPIEMGIIARIVKRVVEDLEATWEPILRVEISDIELETNPEFMQITAASEIVILLAFEVNSTNASGLISLCYPFFTLESILPRLGQQSYVRVDRHNVDERIQKNRARLANTEVPLRAELASGQITAARAEQVQVGDVLRMDTLVDEPTVLYVSDEPKFVGLPFAGPHGRNTVKISEILDPETAERLKNRSRPLPMLGHRG